jgi:hypothetical protein
MLASGMNKLVACLNINSLFPCDIIGGTQMQIGQITQ